jgi:hypothetical protein
MRIPLNRPTKLAALPLLLALLGAGGLVVFNDDGSGPKARVEVLGATTKKPPAVPTITSGPSGPTNSASATFAFKTSPQPTAYLCKLNTESSFSTCNSPKTYPALTERDYIFQVAAQAGGFTSVAAERSWTVDLTPPAPPSITVGPENPTLLTVAHFEYTGDASVVGFECRLDGSAQSCGSSVDYRKVSVGDHTFRVVAVDAAGNRSAPSSPWSWTVLINKAFGISGDAIGPLLPGLAATPLNLRISNPYNFSLKILSVDVTVQSSSSAGCAVEDSFEATTQRFTLTTELVIPANSEASLRSRHPDDWPTDWPAIAMWNNPTVNQDACQNATFNLTYTGTATKP